MSSSVSALTSELWIFRSLVSSVVVEAEGIGSEVVVGEERLTSGGEMDHSVVGGEGGLLVT